MSGKSKAAAGSRKLILAIVFILVVNLSLGFLLTRQSGGALTALMHTRMLDVSNTAAAMLDGDALARLTPADEGTPDYEAVMRTLGVFQDSIALQYIYCVRDMGDGTFTFGLDPTVADPGTFGEPVVVTPALVSAGHGTAAADQEAYTDAWGTFYSAYSPVFASDGAVAGIVAVDFSADWYNTELTTLVRTTAVVAAVSLLAGAAIVLLLSAWQRKELHAVHSQMNVLAENVSVLLRGMDDLTRRPGRAEEPVLTDGEDLTGAGGPDRPFPPAGLPGRSHRGAQQRRLPGDRGGTGGGRDPLRPGHFRSQRPEDHQRQRGPRLRRRRPPGRRRGAGGGLWPRRGLSGGGRRVCGPPA